MFQYREKVRTNLCQTLIELGLVPKAGRGTSPIPGAVDPTSSFHIRFLENNAVDGGYLHQPNRPFQMPPPPPAEVIDGCKTFIPLGTVRLSACAEHG
jgi:hypothetical protein